MAGDEDRASGDPAAPREEIEGRLARLRRSLGARSLAAVIALQRVEVLYFAGSPQDGIVWIPREGEPVFLVRRDLDRARSESPLGRIVPFGRPEEIPAVLAGLGIPLEGPIGTSLDVLPAKLHGSLSRALGVPIEDVSREVRRTRAVKSPWELSRVLRAGALADEAFRFAASILREGMRERELAAEIAAFLIRSGSVAHFRTRAFNMEFSSLCCLAGESGDRRGPSDSPNGSGAGPDPAFGQGAGARPIGRGEPVLVDFGTNRGGYYADITRLFHLGPLPDRFLEAHRTAEEILAASEEALEGGCPLGEAYAGAVRRARAAGLGEAFMGGARFLGHGVGLEIDEWPVIAEDAREPLAEGMVVALEPKFALPGGIVGVETTYIFRDGRLVPVVTLPTEPVRVD